MLRMFPHRAADISCQFGWMHERLSNYNKAISYFHKALDFDPKYAMYYFDLATLYERNRDLTKAIEYYRRAESLDFDFSKEFRLQLHEKLDSLTKKGVGDS